MTPKEIKEKLIENGFKKLGIYIGKQIGYWTFLYDLDNKLFDAQHQDYFDNLIVENITFDRIVALIYGLTGVKI